MAVAVRTEEENQTNASDVKLFPCNLGSLLFVFLITFPISLLFQKQTHLLITNQKEQSNIMVVKPEANESRAVLPTPLSQ